MPPMPPTQSDFELTRDGAEVAAVLRLPGTDPAAVLAAFVTPDLLRRWWPGELDAELEPGGHYRVHFTQLGETMTGTVLAYKPADQLSVTWGWAHEPEQAGRFMLTVDVRADDGGTRLDLWHGPRPGVEVTPREGEVEGHYDGWDFFLRRLPEVVG